MTWIILDIAAALVLIFFIIGGHRRGFIAMALMLVGTLISFWAAQTIAQPSAQWVYDNFAQERVLRYVDHALEDSSNAGEIEELTSLLQDFSDQIDPFSVLNKFREKGGDLVDELNRFLKHDDQGSAIPFPDETDDTDQQDQIKELLQHGSSLSQVLEQTVVRPAVMPFLEMLTFLVFFLIFSMVFKLLIHASRLLNHLPLLGGLNRFFGGLCGLVDGAITLYIIGIILRLLAATSGPDHFLTMEILEETKLLSSIIFFLE